MFFKILIYLIILTIVIISAKLLAHFARPIIKDTTSEYNTFKDYITAVYCKNNKCNTIEYFPKVLLKYDLNNNFNIPNTLYYFNYIYDNAPKSILNNYNIAENLSFTWPPNMGERYKLTAFPYPKSTFILSAVYETISNTVDAYTFPGWNIQRHNPFDFNNSIYNNNYFRNYQDIEVIHACYPPPGQKYPFCDDGGWWLYLATGSGTFWNTGKCLVSNNKLSLLQDIYNCSIKLQKEIQIYNKLNPQKTKQIPPTFGLTINDIANKLKGKGGGNSIMVAIFSIVNSLTKHNFKASVIGFKDMSRNTGGKKAWSDFITNTFLILYLIIVSIIQFFVYIPKVFKLIKNKPIAISLMIILLLIILSVLVYIFFFIVFENFFRGLGWMTLDMALQKTNMNLYEFVEECVTGKLKNPICNSLAMTQMFDIQIETHTYLLQYDSFILTSQPNKTGNWEVEICDLRRYDPKTHGITKDGGVCGNNLGSNNELNEDTRIDICNNKILPKINSHILKAGPIIFDNSGPPFYKPTQECICIENDKRLCTSCKGYLSQKLCINI